MAWQSSTVLHQLPTFCINILLTPKGTYFLFLHTTKIKLSNLFYKHISKKSQKDAIPPHPSHTTLIYQAQASTYKKNHRVLQHQPSTRGMTTMPQTTQKSIPGIIALRIFGLLLFLFLLYIANNLSFFTDNHLNYQIILFLSSQVWLLVLITIAFLIGEIFNALIFPLNLPAPLFNAGGAVLFVGFLLSIFALFDIMLDINIFHIFDTLSFIIYPFVFIIVLIGGYILILQNLVQTEQSPKKGTKTIPDTAAAKTGEAITWEDVGDEFKQALYDLLTLFRSSIKK